MTKQDWIEDMLSAGVMKFGSFRLKSGLESPFYIDLRILLSHPRLMQNTARLLADLVRDQDIEYDVIVGIPYAAIPFASLLSIELDTPLVVLRKEMKGYGSGGNLVGEAPKGARCLIIDDLITTGSSKVETAKSLVDLGLEVCDVVVLIDRSVSGSDEMAEHGLALHSLVSLSDVCERALEEGKIDSELAQRIETFTQTANAAGSAAAGGRNNGNPEPNGLAGKLQGLMREKQSNVVLSLDVNSQAEFFTILQDTAEHICMVKTHVDVLEDWDQSFIDTLKAYQQKFGFLVFEDRKFADIGNTVRLQYRGGPFRIAEWAEFVTVHMISGEAILDGLFEGLHSRGGFLLARMSSAGNLITEDYTQSVLEIGRRRSKVVAGYIGHGEDRAAIRALKMQIPDGQLLLMPGVKAEAGTDALGQRYLTIEDAVSGGADCIIVGRGIYANDSPATAAAEYRKRSWKSLMEREEGEPWTT